jgi:SAM-dependent methyltransferase
MKYTIPYLSNIFLKIRNKFSNHFRNSSSYWKMRYELGGNSGLGSYNELAIFKANIINEFIENNSIQTVIELGCGDGNQLRYAKYPNYKGFDISPKAIEMCSQIFDEDKSKTFFIIDQNIHSQILSCISELAISLDVIFHLIEDPVFDEYMSLLFTASNKFVCIYSSNKNDNSDTHAPHVKHREFSEWIRKNRPEWRLIKTIPNIYPYNGDDRISSFSDFYFYEKLT